MVLGIMVRIAVLAVLLAGCGASHEGDRDGGDVDADTRPMPRRPPPRPTTADAADAAEAVFLLNDVVLDQGEDRWTEIGFDQDGLVTSDERSAMVECVAPTESASSEVDGVNGIDNAFGHQVLPLLLSAMPELESGARRLQAEGVGALLLRVRGWNGGDDDPLVTADLFWTTTLEPAIGVSVSENAVFGRDVEAARLHDDSAYVASGVLVTRIPDRAPLELAMGNGLVAMTLTDAVLVVDFDGRATLAGRWLVLDLIAASPSFGICFGTPEASVLMRLLGVAADVRGVFGTGGPGVACDAISVGLDLAVTPAALAGVGPLPALPGACP